MNNPIHSCFLNSPVGNLKIEANDGGLTAIHFLESDVDLPAPPPNSKPVLLDTVEQLNEYFSGSRSSFNLAIEPEGTLFENEVWQELTNISWGETLTYKELAKRLGDSNKVRAVGRANGQNPLPIVIPCHRVIGANNKLTGYAGGIKRKRWLLQHEGAILL